MHFLLGDLNINCLSNESKILTDVTDVYGLKNLIKEPTCFKSKNGTLIDLIFVSNHRRIFKTFNLLNGVTDFHNMIGFSTKLRFPRRKQHKITYRSYKNFDENAFCKDLEEAPFHIGDIFDEIDDKYDYMNMLLLDVLNEHAPLKTKIPLKKSKSLYECRIEKDITL